MVSTTVATTTGGFCDPLWSMCLEDDFGDGDYQEEDDTINDTVDESVTLNSTLGGYSHLVDSPKSRLQREKKSSKKAQSNRNRTPSTAAQGDKVMEYFLGSGDDTGGEDGERAKHCFRRRRKKLQQLQSPEVPTEKYGVPTEIVSKISKKPDKYSPSENRDAADGISCDSRSTLTAPTIDETHREDPVAVQENLLSKKRGGRQKKLKSRDMVSKYSKSRSKKNAVQEQPSEVPHEIFPKISSSGSKSNSRSKRQSRDDKTPPKASVSQEGQPVRAISSGRSQSRSRADSRSKGRDALSRLRNSQDRYDQVYGDTPGGIATRDSSGTTIDGQRERNQRHHAFVEDQYLDCSQSNETGRTRTMSSDHYIVTTPHISSGERPPRATTPRKRTVDGPPARVFNSWHESPTRQPIMTLGKLPRNEIRDRTDNMDSVRRVVSEDVGIDIHRTPPSPPLAVPHVISDISRRELELRSIGLLGALQTPTTPRVEVNKYNEPYGGSRHQ